MHSSMLPEGSRWKRPCVLSRVHMSDTYRFKSVDRTYCYPGTSVLRNRMGITDGERLSNIESSIATIQIVDLKLHPLSGSFDSNHLCAIHRRIFSSIYEWAGCFRTVDIAIVYPFCHHEYIGSSLHSLFTELHREDCLRSISNRDEMAGRLAYYMGELNVIHPFREGNGRTQRIFFEYLANNAGWSLSFDGVTKEQIANASQAAFFQEYGPLRSVILRSLERRRR